jgi:hypothetical protein
VSFFYFLKKIYKKSPKGDTLLWKLNILLQISFFFFKLLKKEVEGKKTLVGVEPKILGSLINM